MNMIIPSFLLSYNYIDIDHRSINQSSGVSVSSVYINLHISYNVYLSFYKKEKHYYYYSLGIQSPSENGNGT